MVSIVSPLISSCMHCKLLQTNRLSMMNKLETLDGIKEFTCIWFGTIHGLFTAGQTRQDS
jgi:hypothetical protein